jgi:hypothetical protein
VLTGPPCPERHNKLHEQPLLVSSLYRLSCCHADQGATATAIMATGVDAKLLKSTKFPPEFNQKVDMGKVNIQVMKK